MLCTALSGDVDGGCDVDVDDGRKVEGFGCVWDGSAVVKGDWGVCSDGCDGERGGRM